MKSSGTSPGSWVCNPLLEFLLFIGDYPHLRINHLHARCQALAFLELGPFIARMMIKSLGRVAHVPCTAFELPGDRIH
jgi:hypothetical protein